MAPWVCCDPVLDRGERCELALTSDQRGQPTLFRYLEPRAADDLADDGIRTHRLGLAFYLEIAQVFEDEESVPEMLGASADEDLARLGEAEKARREVSGIAHRRVVHAQISADGADHHEARIDPHAHLEVDPVLESHFFGERFEPVLDR